MAAGRDDLRLAWGWCDHVKTLKLIRLIGFEGPYRLLRLWKYAAENVPATGRFSSVDDLETAAGWLGAPGAFQQALLACGWLDEDGLTLHDWVEEQPYVAKRQERLAKARLSGAEGGRRSVEARRVAQGSASPTLQGSSKGTLEGVLRGPSRVVEPPLPSPPFPSEENQALSGGPDPISEIQRIWNEVAAPQGLLTSRVLNPKRKRVIGAALKQHSSLDFWRRVFTLIAADPHCRGQNDRGWKASIDYPFQGNAVRWIDKALTADDPPPVVEEAEPYSVRLKRGKWEGLRGAVAAGRTLSEPDLAELAHLDTMFGAVGGIA